MRWILCLFLFGYIYLFYLQFTIYICFKVRISSFTAACSGNVGLLHSDRGRHELKAVNYIVVFRHGLHLRNDITTYLKKSELDIENNLN